MNEPIHADASWKYSTNNITKGIPCGVTGPVRVTSRHADVTCTDCRDVLSGRAPSPAEKAEEPTEAVEAPAEPRSTEACWTAIYNHAPPGTWTRLADIKAAAGLTQDGLERGVTFLLAETDDVEVEPEPFGWRITAEMREAAVVLGGEARHLVRLPA